MNTTTQPEVGQQPTSPRIASSELIEELHRLLDALSQVGDDDVRAIAENTRARLFGAEQR